MNIKWNFKEDAEPQGKGEFWYDLVWGGYIDISEVLADDNQQKLLQDAINTVASFERAMMNNDLLTEM